MPDPETKEARTIAGLMGSALHSPYGPELTAILRGGGWRSDRIEPWIAEQYRRLWGEAEIPQAFSFVRRFGGLSFGHGSLSTTAEGAASDLSQRTRVEQVVGCRCCPVATSYYAGEGGTVWIDEKGRFYYLDPEGMMFLGGTEEEALDALLRTLFVRRPEPPEEIREAVLRAYAWNDPEAGLRYIQEAPLKPRVDDSMKISLWNRIREILFNLLLIGIGVCCGYALWVDPRDFYGWIVVLSIVGWFVFLIRKALRQRRPSPSGHRSVRRKWLPRIYADFNGLDATVKGDACLVLDGQGTRNDLEKLNLTFREGMAATFYDDDVDDFGKPDDIEVDGIVTFDPVHGWVAVIHRNEFRHASERAS